VAAPPSSAGARRALALATAAYVLGMTAHTTFIFYLAPVGLRVAGVLGRDAWVFSGTAVATMLAVLPAGRLADALPRRRVLRVGLGLLALSYAPLLVAPTFPGILLATAFSGTGLAFLFVSFTSYVADLLSRGEVSSAYGVSGALAILAGALGPFVGSLLFRAAPDELLALRLNAALFGAGALAGLLLTFLLPAVRAPGKAREAGKDGSDARAALPVVWMYLLMGAGYGMMLPYFAVYFLDALRLSPGTWGLLLAASTLAGAVGSVAAGRLGRGHPHLTLLGGQAVHAFACLAFLLPAGAALLGLAYVVRNLFATGVAPVANALLAVRARPAGRARAQAYASLAWNLGWALGAVAGGVLLGVLGGALFPLAALLGLAGAALGVLALRRGAARPAAPPA
jgi:predicted MFS family arabinose efflux permease